MLCQIAKVKSSKGEIAHEKMLKEKFHNFRKEENWPDSCSLENNWGFVWLPALRIPTEEWWIVLAGPYCYSPSFLHSGQSLGGTPFLCFRRNIDKPKTERFCAYSFEHSSHVSERLFTWCHQAKSAGSSRLASNVSSTMGSSLSSLNKKPLHKRSDNRLNLWGVCLSTGWKVLPNRFSNAHLIPHDPMRCEALQAIVIMCQLLNQAVRFLKI